MIVTETSIYEFARQNLDSHRNRIALRYYGTAITYGRLFEMIDNVADHLAQLGVGEGTVVSIHLPNCPQAVMALYAVAKLGGICGLVHPQMPAAALDDYMRTTKSKILITSDIFHEANNIGHAEVLIVARISAHFGPLQKVAAVFRKNPAVAQRALLFEQMEAPCRQKAITPRGEALAYKCALYLHSSGTTGTPKIVMHSHWVCNRYIDNILDYVPELNFTNSTTITTLPMFHSGGLLTIYHLFVPTKGEMLMIHRFDPRLVTRLVRRHRVNVLAGVPGMYRALLRTPGFTAKRMKSLKACFAFGDMVGSFLKKEIDRRLDPMGARRILYESYSLSEFAAGGATEKKGQADRMESAGKSEPICRFAILRDDTIYPQSAEGEILISGETMMMGYLDDDGQDSPFIQQDNICWFRTGDYGRIDEDGYIYILGRIKNMIIRNGYNVFPSELEALFQQIPDVKEVCVIGIHDPEKETQQIVVCAVRNDNTPEGEVRRQIMESAERHLPSYAIPNRVVFLNAIPRNRNGKADRMDLRRQLEG